MCNTSLNEVFNMRPCRMPNARGGGGKYVSSGDLQLKIKKLRMEMIGKLTKKVNSWATT